MPALSRSTGKLLGTVGLKPHATQSDHVDALPKRPSPASSKHKDSILIIDGERPTRLDNDNDDDDIHAEPISSDDEPAYSVSSSAVPLASSQITNETHTSSPYHAPPKSGVVFRLPGADKSLEQMNMSRDDETVFSSSVPSSQQQKTGTFANIHARPVGPKKKPSLYGKSKSSRPLLAPNRKRKRDDKGFLIPAGPGGSLSASAKATFKIADGAEFQQNHVDHNDSGLSSPPASIIDDEILIEDSDDSDSLIGQINCTVCNNKVPLVQWELFQDRYKCDSQLNYKWSLRFCRFHRRHEAQQEWQRMSYPDIDWDTFVKRLGSADRRRRLDAILSGQKRGIFQDRHENRLKGRKRTVMQAIRQEDGEDVKGGGVGYYGPRGEKLITEYILQDFSDRLRARSTKERVIAAAGVAGGVSGFVQAILTPELAVSLIAEDMQVSEVQAEKIMAESATMGELLFPEEEDIFHLTRADSND